MAETTVTLPDCYCKYMHFSTCLYFCRKSLTFVDPDAA